MRARFVILLGVNILLVVGVLFFTRNWLAGNEPAPAPIVQAPTPQEDMVEVLTTAVELKAGTLIKPSHLRWQRWPEDNMSDSYLTRSLEDDNDDEFDEQTQKGEDAVAGGVIRYGLAEGQPFVKSSYVKPGDRGFLAAILTPGMRAVSISITASTGGAGLILPGDRADVLMTQKVSVENAEGDDEDRIASETILSNIRIIALDQKVNGNPEDPEVARTATLEVSAKQAEILAVAQDLGRLSLSLRSIQTTGKEPRRGPTWDYAASAALRSPGANTQITAPVVVRGGGKVN